MNGLAVQIAFTVPFSLPLVAAATLYRLNWFYPAFMIGVGATLSAVYIPCGNSACLQVY